VEPKNPKSRITNFEEMKRISIVLLMVMMLSSSFGQNADKKWSIGLLGGKTEYKGEIGDGFFKDKTLYVPVGLSLNHYLNPSFDIGIQVESGDIGFMEFNVNSFLARKTEGILLLKYKFNNGYIFKEDALIAPYFAAGLGLAGFTGSRTKEGGLDGIMPLGGGINVNITPAVALQYQFLYNFTNGDDRDLIASGSNDKFIEHTLGIIFSFGVPKDSDKDGIPDKLDKCPETPAGVMVTPNGCPVDGDNDGIADYLDKCPTVAGIAAFDGCPDSDGDGVQDSQDKCPNVKGLASLNGCPDSDGDGITDLDDKCPNVKGIAALNGCPDTDGDGITDSEDRCPFAKGTKELNGCPDTDNDGIPDIDDKCPSVFGIVANKGCPEVKAETIKVFTRAMTDVLFETGKDIIRRSSYSILENIVNIMKENPAYNLSIDGHCDAVGSDAMNLDLSQRRAASTKKYLIDKGVDANRLSTNGYGESMPVATNNTSAGRTKNRRVEFKVTF
jgi:outer membrane protein OmpA-like peptidoglycan-associated protein